MSGRGAWRIGGYVADSLIGYGASAQVWRGHVNRGGEAVALKVLDLSDAAAVRAAKAEAALLSALDHPNLVRLRELVPDGESVVLVLELAGGGSLADLLARRGRLSPGEVVVALSPIAAALAYAHDAGVVHSDVSPANVLFRADGSPLLADLGVARLVGGFDAPRSTLAYVDPGVAGGGVPSDASDVFMVAATALHALTGAPPWSGDSAEAMLDQAVDGEIPGLDRRLAGIPHAVADVVRRGLDPSPAARGSAAEFALDLRHAAAPVPVDLDAGPSTTGSGGAGPPVFYAAVGEFDAVEVGDYAGGDFDAVEAVDGAVGDFEFGDIDVGRDGPVVTDALSRRAINRAGPTSIAPSYSDRLDAGYAYDRARGETAGAVDGTLGHRHVPRHAAPPTASGSSAVRDPKDLAVPVVLDRPDFTRPGGAGIRPAAERRSAVGRAPVHDTGPAEPPVALTHIVRARIRPAENEPTRRRLAAMPWGRNAAVAATIIVLVAGGVLATWLRWARTGSSASSAGSTPSAGPSTSTPTPSAGPIASTGSAGRASPTRTGADPSRPLPPGQDAPGPTPSVHRSGPRLPAGPSRAGPSAGPTPTPAWPRTDQAWVALLSGLDRRRQVAFATDDPAPLADVYVDGALLDQDRRTLHQVVPPGCHLIGLTTSYRDVHVTSVGAQQSVLTTQASLSASRLQCPRQPTRIVPAHAPVAMTLVLAPVGQRLLIAGITMT